MAQIRDSGFASITFDHELKELAPQIVLRSEQKRNVLWSGTRTVRFSWNWRHKPFCVPRGVLWPGIVRVCDLSEQKQFLVVRKFSGCDHSEQKRFLWSASFKFVVINYQCVAKLGFMLKMFLLSPALIAGRCGYGSWGIGAHCSYIGGNREGIFVPASFQRPFFQKLFSYYYYF